MALRPLVLAAAALVATLVSACSRDEPPGEAGAAAPRSPIQVEAADAGSTVRASAYPMLPPRAPVAGISGLLIESKVVFGDAPERPHRLSATYIFPARVRLRLAHEQGERLSRVIAYRFGEQGYFLDQGTDRSTRLEGDEERQLLLQTELRRALFLWPDGLTWTAVDRVRQAEVPGLGVLIAELDARGERPIAMASKPSFEGPGEELRSIEWTTTGARAWPARFELWSEGESIWTEQVASVETSLDFVDGFFLPPDRRREGGQEDPADALEVETVELPARLELAGELTAADQGSIAAARAAAALAQVEWFARGLATHTEVRVDLDAHGRATGWSIRADLNGGALPPGWVERPAGTVHECAAQAPAAALGFDPDQLDAFARRCPPADARARIGAVFGGDGAVRLRLP